MRPRGAQQGGGLGGLGAELAGEIVACRAGRQGDAHDQAEIAGIAGFRQDLREFIGAVEHEIAHGVHMVGFGNGRACLHRMHKMDVGCRKQAPDQGHLGERRAIELAHAAGPEGMQHRRVRIALHRIENVAREGGD